MHRARFSLLALFVAVTCCAIGTWWITRVGAMIVLQLAVILCGGGATLWRWQRHPNMTRTHAAEAGALGAFAAVLGLFLLLYLLGAIDRLVFGGPGLFYGEYSNEVYAMFCVTVCYAIPSSLFGCVVGLAVRALANRAR